jgi:DNA-binding PadR family transcriptional regulator
MSAMAPTSRLGYALLGLLQQKPSSGYDLRKVFSSTAMKTYSDSPGAIYPALRRLEQQGLIRGNVEDRSGLRRRQVFRLTPKGLSALKQWIMLPIVPDDLARGEQEFMLRFAFSEATSGSAAAVKLLQSLEVALQASLPPLREQLDTLRSQMPTSARLAFECGIRGSECWLEWAHYALATYEKQKKGHTS